MHVDTYIPRVTASIGCFGPYQIASDKDPCAYLHDSQMFMRISIKWVCVCVCVHAAVVLRRPTCEKHRFLFYFYCRFPYPLKNGTEATAACLSQRQKHRRLHTINNQKGSMRCKVQENFKIGVGLVLSNEMMTTDGGGWCSSCIKRRGKASRPLGSWHTQHTE